MSNKPTSLMKRRLNVFVGLVLLLFCGYTIFTLANASVIKSYKYQNYANSQLFSEQVLNANRGAIYDSKGEVFAKSSTVYTIYLDPTTMRRDNEEKKEIIFEGLAEILDIDIDYIRERAEKKTGYEVLKRKTDELVADEVIAFKKENRLNCIGCTPDTKRFYPNNDLAASVIGFTGFEGDGQYGLEYQYNEYLSGTAGKIITAKDANGKPMPYKYEQIFEAQDGNSLVLNIDSTIQYYLERELKNTVDEHKPNERACGIIMNARTGQILAMASVPGYDLNNPTDILDTNMTNLLEELEKGSDEYLQARAVAWERQWKNKAITELYFPGSVFKVITGSAAIEEKAVTLDTTFNCTGSYKVLDTTFNCHGNKVHGTQNFLQAMTNSCNPAFVQIGQALGYQNFVNYFIAYGLAEKTGIDLPGEVSSINMSTYPENAVTLASSAFGQTNKVTPMEMITAYSAVINGGNLVTPYVVDKIIDGNGNIVEQFEPVIKRQVISEDTSKIMRDTLEQVCVANGGSNAYIKGFSIGGKSGTSQKIDISGGEDIYVSSYCAFAPADDPEIIMLVMVDEPSQGDYYGSRVAAPVVRSVFEEVLPYLGYFPEYTEDEFEKMEVILPSVVGKDFESAKKTLEALQIDVEIVGEGNKVLKQIPQANEKMPRNGTIYLFTQEQEVKTAKVPNVVGMTLNEVDRVLTNAGFNFLATGGAAQYKNALSVSQTHLGERLEKGSVIEVEFMSNDETG